MTNDMVLALEREVQQRGGFGIRFVVFGEIFKCEVYASGPPGRDGKRTTRYLPIAHRVPTAHLPEVTAKLKRDGFGVLFSGIHPLIQQLEAASNTARLPRS